MKYVNLQVWETTEQAVGQTTVQALPLPKCTLGCWGNCSNPGFKEEGPSSTLRLLWGLHVGGTHKVLGKSQPVARTQWVEATFCPHWRPGVSSHFPFVGSLSQVLLLTATLESARTPSTRTLGPVLGTGHYPRSFPTSTQATNMP